MCFTVFFPTDVVVINDIFFIGLSNSWLQNHAKLKLDPDTDTN